jgi:hypothetical protein
MLFPKNGGANDSRSVFVIIKNIGREPLAPNQDVLIPDKAQLQDDDRYIQSARVKVVEYILPEEYGAAKLLSAVLYAD